MSNYSDSEWEKLDREITAAVRVVGAVAKGGVAPHDFNTHLARLLDFVIHGGYVSQRQFSEAEA